MDKTKQLERAAVEVRKRLVKLIYDAKGGHTGGSLSSVDILTALYMDVMHVDPKTRKWKIVTALF